MKFVFVFVENFYSEVKMTTNSANSVACAFLRDTIFTMQQHFHKSFNFHISKLEYSQPSAITCQLKSHQTGLFHLNRKIIILFFCIGLFSNHLQKEGCSFKLYYRREASTNCFFYKNYQIRSALLNLFQLRGNFGRIKLFECCKNMQKPVPKGKSKDRCRIFGRFFCMYV